MFQQRHYLVIALAIREVHTVTPAYATGALYNLVLNLSDYFQDDNPHFKRPVFVAACGFAACPWPSVAVAGGPGVGRQEKLVQTRTANPLTGGAQADSL